MDLQIFENEVLKQKEVLWQSKCNGNSKIMNYLFIIPLLLIIALPFTIHFMGFGALAIAELVLFVVSLVVLLVIFRKFFKWNSPYLIFTITEDGLFMVDNNPKSESYFSTTFTNIVSYSYKKEKDNLITVTINLKVLTQAGMFGKITSLKMVKIEDFERLQKVLSEHNVEAVEEK